MTIINSMDMPTYVGILLIMFVLSIYSIVKYRKIKEPWKVLIYLAPPEFIVFIANRIIKEYWSNTHLYNISSTVALITGGIVMTSIFVVGIITKIKESVEAILFAYTYYLSAHFRRLLAIFVLICNVFIIHNAKPPLLSFRKQGRSCMFTSVAYIILMQ